jgi:flagellar biosynthesis protein FlhF
MNIRRFTAPDMRQALARVRDVLGPDAVILASRKSERGVEISAAEDRELAAIDAFAAPAAAPAVPAAGGFRATIATRDTVPGDEAIGSELRTLRRILETQLASLAWNDLTRRAPVATQLLRELTEMGIARDLASDLIDTLPGELDLEQGRSLALARFADRLVVTDDRWGRFGGVVAFVGTAGSGRTTALARLATQWILRHGPTDIALVSTDGAGYGAHERIRRLGRLLAVPSYAIDDLAELPSVLTRLEGHRLVLLDTAALAPTDTALAACARALQSLAPRVELAICLSAVSQAAALARTLASLPQGCASAGVLTRLDECVSLGGALSAVAAAGLPLAYAGEGPSMDDGLVPARALDLILRAAALVRQHGAVADEDLLARRFGGRAHAVA